MGFLSKFTGKKSASDKPFCTICGHEIEDQPDRVLRGRLNHGLPSGMPQREVDVCACTRTNQCKRTGESNLGTLGMCGGCGYVYYLGGGWISEHVKARAKAGEKEVEIDCPCCGKSLGISQAEIQERWDWLFG